MGGAAHVHLDPATATGVANDQADAAPQRPGSLSAYAEGRMDPVSTTGLLIEEEGAGEGTRNASPPSR